MKYKNLKAISNDGMKKVLGGKIPTGGGAGKCSEKPTCDGACTLSNGDEGHCHAGTAGCFCVGAGA